VEAQWFSSDHGPAFVALPLATATHRNWILVLVEILVPHVRDGIKIDIAKLARFKIVPYKSLKKKK
jgi:hypothetical protein